MRSTKTQDKSPKPEGRPRGTGFTPKVEDRLAAIVRYRKAREDGLKCREAAEVAGHPPSTIREWIRRHCEDPTVAASKTGSSRAPRRVKRTPELVERVASLRQQFAWSSKKIGAYLRKEGWDISPNSVEVVLDQLRRGGVVAPILAGKNLTVAARRQPSPASLGKKVSDGRRGRMLTWGERKGPAPALRPGELVEIDSMSATLAGGAEMEFVSAVDVVSRYAWSLPCNLVSPAVAARLLDMVCEAGSPLQAQIDCGTEFGEDFDLVCRRRGIFLHVLPPGCPNLNPHIECFNAILRREFLNYWALPNEIGGVERMLRRFLSDYHRLRPHGSLGYMTPYECYPPKVLADGDAVPGPERISPDP